ncbi:hypothetical protein DV515_00000540 [Chloebia gouldiae]|uniref:Uncharacterized protein n=1 Tax=Chloebia gouldiae TaxID=44316 RepID=A0A3L8T213_CHLGU|nr:hypothetical protein DV515_00000540 [Chloebia gouldiae]
MEKHQEMNKKASSAKEPCSALPSAAGHLCFPAFPGLLPIPINSCGLWLPAQKLDVQLVAVQESQDSQNWPLKQESASSKSNCGLPAQKQPAYCI